MDIREQIQDFLARKGVKKIKLAELAGVHPSTITRIVNGDRQDLKMDTYQKLVAAMTNLDGSDE